ncbi:DNA primase [Patescibacteria group bacterium]|nr:DNA primase [Patescibacteria group bacterium]
MSDLVSEIKSRLNIEEVVSGYVKLKPAGRNLKGLCPFHNEKTPSFMVSPEKQIAYCFGCHKGGDLFAFVEAVEGVEFKEAVEILADKAGIDVSKYRDAVPSQHNKTEKEEIYDIHRKAADFYADILHNTSDGKKVFDYLIARGLSDGTIQDFKLGFAPDSFDNTHLHLVKGGFSRKMLALSGMAILKDTGSEHVYDRFRARLIIPIYDSLGRIVGFGGRALKKDEQPKYLNSPDSPVYSKSEVLYGYNFAKDAIKEKGNVILVEGYFDVMMLHQAGVRNVVATSGTALTIQQIKLLKRFTKDFIFCFDTDDAGVEAAKRGFQLAQKEDVNVDVITVPGEKDPADFIKNNLDGWSDVEKNKVPFMEFCMNDLEKKYDLNVLDGKKRFLDAIIPYLLMIKSSFERDHYVRIVARKLDAKEVQIYDGMKKTQNAAFKIKDEIEINPYDKAKKVSRKEILFGLILEYPQVLEKHMHKIPIEDLNETEKSIYNTFKDNYNLLRAGGLSEEFLLCFDDELRKRLEFVSLYIDEAYATFTDLMIEAEFIQIVEYYQGNVSKQLKRDLTAKIREAEKTGDNTLKKELLEKFNKLMTN